MSLVVMPSLVALSGGKPCSSTPCQRAIERIGAGLSERVCGRKGRAGAEAAVGPVLWGDQQLGIDGVAKALIPSVPVSYTHLRAHETRHDLVCRLLLEKQK